VLIAVGDTAERVSKRRLDPFPNVLVCEVLRDSLGRDCRGWAVDGDSCECEGGVTTKEVVILLDDRS
jgi:hypothetical protein